MHSQTEWDLDRKRRNPDWYLLRLCDGGAVSFYDENSRGTHFFGQVADYLATIVDLCCLESIGARETLILDDLWAGKVTLTSETPVTPVILQSGNCTKK